MNETWKREIDKVYMSDVICLDEETVEKIEDGHRMGAIFSRNPSEGSVVFHSESVVKELKREVAQRDTEIYRLKAERDEIYGLLGSAHLELRQQLEHGYHPNAIKSTLISVGQYAPKLKAKMEEQEPWCMKMNDCKTKCEDCPVEVAQPQRTWVGLAAEDRLTAKYMQDAPDGIEAVIDYIETKLKEKNCD